MGLEGFCSKCGYNDNYYLKGGHRCNKCLNVFCEDCSNELSSCKKCAADLCYLCQYGHYDYILCKDCNKQHDFCFDCFRYNNCKCIKEKTYLHLLPKDIKNIINEMLKRT